MFSVPSVLVYIVNVNSNSTDYLVHVLEHLRKEKVLVNYYYNHIPKVI